MRLVTALFLLVWAASALAQIGPTPPSNSGPVVASGTYTPTLTCFTNCASANVQEVFMYTRTGNVVFVSGSIDMTPTSASILTNTRISLPVSTNITSDFQLSGTATSWIGGGSPVVNGTGVMVGNVTDNATLLVTPLDTTQRYYKMVFSYTVQ